MGNGKSSPAAPTDTPLNQIMNQSGSGIASGVGAVLGVSPNTSGGVATLGTAPINGQCVQFNSAGQAVPAGGACTVGAGGGTVNAGTKGQIAAYNASTNAVVGIPAQCTPIETFGGDGNNSTVNDTPFDNLVAAFGTNGGCIGFAPGIYSFSSARTIKVVGVRLIDAESVKALFEPEKPCKQEHR
jgi:hypothetical protein